MGVPADECFRVVFAWCVGGGDYHATSNGFPLVDEKQDYTLLSLTEADGQTTMTFWSPVKLIYAYGTTDDIGYHCKSRGTIEVNLLNFMPRSSPL
ncbi:unnamed protein product, partial [Coregonus sp. 'balchen']